MTLYAVIRIRGIIGVRRDIQETLRHLRLVRKYHCVLVPNDETHMGMLRKAKDYITWGEVDLETLEELIRKRGRLIGDKPITDEYAQKIGFENVRELAKALIEGKVRYKDLPDVKPVFRLAPPRGGFRSTKRPYKVGGDLGYRGSAINDLLRRMM
ncbi:MAG: 50S ribosomal protein L30 [Thermoplasmata archaeon]|nr:MAG: 50S ribosomal protein L30 [Thermoplasmata archaeon]